MPLRSYFVDLLLKAVNLLPVGVLTCFVSTDMQIDETIGHLYGPSAFFRVNIVVSH